MQLYLKSEPNNSGTQQDRQNNGQVMNSIIRIFHLHGTAEQFEHSNQMLPLDSIEYYIENRERRKHEKIHCFQDGVFNIWKE